VQWWCAPRFDSPSVFARILDDDGGHFTIRPQHIVSISREYEDGSMVLSTTFQTEKGRVQVRDALVMAEGCVDMISASTRLMFSLVMSHVWTELCDSRSILLPASSTGSPSP
jgi:GH15 family glucan-1,4-alpha-glucosidase